MTESSKKTLVNGTVTAVAAGIILTIVGAFVDMNNKVVALEQGRAQNAGRIDEMRDDIRVIRDATSKTEIVVGKIETKIDEHMKKESKP